MADVFLERGISKGILNGNPLFVLTTEQTSRCLFRERLGLNGLPMDYVFFGRLLHLNSGSQTHVITGHPDI